MKKLVLSVILSVTFFTLHTAQIAIKMGGTDFSGQTITIQNTSGLEEVIDLEVENMSAADQTWKITRLRLDVPAIGWSDLVCWQFGLSGACYPANTQNPWTTNAELTIPASNHGALAIHIDPDNVVNNQARYRYYIIDNATTTAVDSVDVLVTTSALSLKEQKQQTVFSIMPNPADNTLTINTPSSSDGIIKITDVLGKAVFEDKINSVKKIDVGSFKNGVYVATLIVNGTLSTKRFVVKH